MQADRQGKRLRRSMLLTLAGPELAASALGVPAPAAAQPATAETIIARLSPTSEATAPPYVITGVGTFSASGAISDSGTVAVAAQQVAIGSQTHGTLQGSFTLSGQAGTLILRCHDASTDYSDLAAVPGAGSCAITGGTGTYAGVHGQGAERSTTSFSTANFLDDVEVMTVSLNVV